MRAREKMAAVRRGVTLRRKRVREDAAVRRGVTLRRRRVVRKVARIRKRVTRMCGMRCRKPCHSAMEHEEFDDTTEADCARSQASRPSSAASSQASVRS